MKINIITLFPNVIEPFFNVLPYRRAIEKGLLDVKFWNLRDYAIDEYGSVDDKPYGGGKGMILRIEPIYDALQDIKKSDTEASNSTQNKIVLLSPKGILFSQEKAKEYSKLDNITLICGRYEGVDQRVSDHLADETISIGNYVLAGGESASLVVMESTIRLLPGVLEEQTLKFESFENDEIEYPQYTRPEEFNGWKVPEVLLSGHHEKIDNWKKSHSKNLT